MPRNKYPEETVKKILDVSLKLFLEKGFEQTTVLDIVDNLGGLTRGAFYHHFKSKEEVLNAIFDRRYEEQNPIEKAKQAKGLNGLDRTRLVLKLSLLQNLDGDRLSDLAVLGVALLNNPRFLVQQVENNQEVAEYLVPIIEEGMADGSIKAGNPKFIAELFMLLTNFWLIPSIFPCSIEESFEKAEMIEQILESLGFPIVNEELKETFTHVFNIVTKNFENTP